MKVPFIDLKAQYRQIKDEVQVEIEKVLDHTAYILGPAVASFEERFASYAGVRHAVAVNSGTSALHLALLALGIGPGDEVLVPAMTFIATASAVDYSGAKFVPVDVDPATYTMDPEKIEERITGRTKAIMPVHLYGQPADMDAIAAIAKKHGLFVVEDAAQAHGAEYKGRRCGGIGDIAGFSFYPGKNLGAYGEGGAVTTNNPEFAEKVRMMRDWGAVEKYHHVVKGYNYRMDGIQGAVLGVKMNYIEGWTDARRAAAAKYSTVLEGLPLTLPVARQDVRHVYHIYAVLLDDRDAVIGKLQEAGVASGIHYPIPVHMHKCFEEYGYGEGDFPVAERIGRKELTLPMFPEITDDQIRAVSEALSEILT